MTDLWEAQRRLSSVGAEAKEAGRLLEVAAKRIADSIPRSALEPTD